MTPPIPWGEPASAVAGDTWKWQRSVPDYPASDGWALTYRFRGIGTLDVLATTNMDGASFLVTAAASATGRLPEGSYEWTARVSNGTETYTVDSGRLAVLADFAAVAGGARQPHIERALALVEAQIEQVLATPVESYGADGITVQRRKLSDLRRERNLLRAELAAIKRGGRLSAYVAEFGPEPKTQLAEWLRNGSRSGYR